MPITLIARRDRRSYHRLTHHCEARVEGVDAGACRLADLSADGAFVDTRTVLPVGTRTRLRFSLEGQEIDVRAEVRYVEPGIGMGLRFIDLPEVEYANILTFILRVWR